MNFEDEFLEDLKELLRKRTVKEKEHDNAPFGYGILDGLKCALEISNKYGFNTVNLDNFIGYAEYGEGDDYVGVLGHIDVVPQGNNWDQDPFNPIIKDGKIYARGSLDDKGPILCALYALKLIKDSNIKLSKKVRVIFGTNEESGTADIDHYLKKEKPPILCFTPDAYFPIVTSEKGILTFELIKKFQRSLNGYKIEYIRGGKKSNVVPDYCECKLIYDVDRNVVDDFKDTNLKNRYKIITNVEKNVVVIRSSGKSSHGSTPERGNNAISNMLIYLNKTLRYEDEFSIFLNEFSNIIGFDYTGEKLNINFSDEESGKLTLNLGIINGDTSEIRMRFNVRYPVKANYEKIISNIKERIQDKKFIFEMGNHNPPLHFKKDHKLVLALKKAYEESTGDVAELLSTGGGTYAKLMPNTVAFGPIFDEKHNLCHQANENIELSLLKKCIEIYARAIYELAK
ncbi:dipeptidase PepV [Clostridium uliginosum]|uniref:Succinyl-diaminopimelate desuccinylase n=1 Tax=Clostridium uliginosum TaxID=119641 RepID=A0A1I1NGI4_9CLOT|nr:dipeptidase PepV [Clostridium uliginosum]SFC93863.1 succinyl-diaminopimelate desuccinylase [Clostridium uliginosum]